MTKNRFGPDIFEGHELAALWSDNPLEARKMLQELLDDKSYAESISTPQRQAAIRLFGKEKIKADWSAYLG